MALKEVDTLHRRYLLSMLSLGMHSQRSQMEELDSLCKILSTETGFEYEYCVVLWEIGENSSPEQALATTDKIRSTLNRYWLNEPLFLSKLLLRKQRLLKLLSLPGSHELLEEMSNARSYYRCRQPLPGLALTLESIKTVRLPELLSSIHKSSCLRLLTNCSSLAGSALLREVRRLYALEHPGMFGGERYPTSKTPISNAVNRTEADWIKKYNCLVVAHSHLRRFLLQGALLKQKMLATYTAFYINLW